MDNLHISAGTIARTLVLVLAIVNQILSACGKRPPAHRIGNSGAAGNGRVYHRRRPDCMVEEQQFHPECAQG